MRSYVLSIDAGTTSVRCMLFGHGGEVLAVSQAPLTQHYPGPGMVEHDATEMRNLCRSCIGDCLFRPGIEASGCVAVGITNQRETVVVWDRRTGTPVYNAIVWQDRRTADFCEEMRSEGLEAEVHSKTGLQIDAYFSGTKVRCILDNVDGARDAAEHGHLLFGTVESWLIWNLTSGKVHATDYTNASRTMLFDINELDWDDSLLDMMSIPRTMLPEPCPPGHIFGCTDPGVAGVSAPISGAIGDQQAALFGQGCHGRGDVKITFGTGGFLLMNIGEEPRMSSQGLLTTVACGHGNAPCYAIEGSVYIAGAVVQWLRDELQILEDSAQTEAMAESVPDTAGCYIVPAFVGLGAPYWDQNARGIIVGLTRGTNRCHMARAALESIAYQAWDVIRAMEEDTGIDMVSVKVDGGASANDFLCQFLADITGLEVQRPKCIESTALGAAYLAGITVGFWEDSEEVRSKWVLDRRFEPSMCGFRRDECLNGWRRAVRCAEIWSGTEDRSE